MAELLLTFTIIILLIVVFLIYSQEQRNKQKFRYSYFNNDNPRNVPFNQNQESGKGIFKTLFKNFANTIFNNEAQKKEIFKDNYLRYLKYRNTPPPKEIQPKKLTYDNPTGFFHNFNNAYSKPNSFFNGLITPTPIKQYDYTNQLDNNINNNLINDINVNHYYNNINNNYSFNLSRAPDIINHFHQKQEIPKPKVYNDNNNFRVKFSNKKNKHDFLNYNVHDYNTNRFSLNNNNNNYSKPFEHKNWNNYNNIPTILQNENKWEHKLLNEGRVEFNRNQRFSVNYENASRRKNNYVSKYPVQFTDEELNKKFKSR